jgi:hypothetical protein
MSLNSPQTCANCGTWDMSFKLGNKVTTCAELGFESTDTCEKWSAKTLGDGCAPVEKTRGDSPYVVRVKEPTLAEILEHPEMREPWVAFRAKLDDTPCYYNEAEGAYYFGFGDEHNANVFATSLLKEPYVCLKHGFVMPLSSIQIPEGSVRVTASTRREFGFIWQQKPPTAQHRPAVWENRLGTVFAMDEAGNVQYFDYDHDAAVAFADVAPDRDLRVSEKTRDVRYTKRGDTNEPALGKTIYWVRRDPKEGAVGEKTSGAMETLVTKMPVVCRFVNASTKKLHDTAAYIEDQLEILKMAERALQTDPHKSIKDPNEGDKVSPAALRARQVGRLKQVLGENIFKKGKFSVEAARLAVKGLKVLEKLRKKGEGGIRAACQKKHKVRFKNKR